MIDNSAFLQYLLLAFDYLFCFFFGHLWNWWLFRNFRVRPTINFINILRANVLHKRCFGSLSLVTWPLKKLPKQSLYKKLVCKTLMKLTPLAPHAAQGNPTSGPLGEILVHHLWRNSFHFRSFAFNWKPF